MRKIQRYYVYTDGAIRPEQGLSGLAAIVRDECGQICYWWKQRSGALTCNEAEYAAAILALENLYHQCRKRPALEVYSDSQVMVTQMQGYATAHAPALRQAQARLRALVVQFPQVRFHHIARQHNRLADALAFEALAGEQTR